MSVDVGDIDVTEPLHRGRSYNLPAIGVENPGDEPSGYSMGVGPIDGQQELIPDREWFRFFPEDFSLAPGEKQTVEIVVTIPSDALPGDYSTLLRAQIASEGDGPTVGVAAATRLEFTVEVKSAWDRLGLLMTDNSPWSWILLIALALSVLLWMLNRRFRFRMSVERRH